MVDKQRCSPCPTQNPPRPADIDKTRWAQLGKADSTDYAHQFCFSRGKEGKAFHFAIILIQKDNLKVKEVL